MKDIWVIIFFFKLGNKYDIMIVCFVWEGVLNEIFNFFMYF